MRGYFGVEIEVISLSSRRVVYEGFAFAMMERLFVDHPNSMGGRNDTEAFTVSGSHLTVMEPYTMLVMTPMG